MNAYCVIMKLSQILSDLTTYLQFIKESSQHCMKCYINSAKVLHLLRYINCFIRLIIKITSIYSNTDNQIKFALQYISCKVGLGGCLEYYCLIYSMLAMIFLDNDEFKTSYCHPRYQNGPFFHETTGKDELSKRFSTELSLLPPVNDGCYLTIYYEGTSLEDKIYLLPRRRLLSQNNIWHLTPKSNYSYNYDQYIMETAGTKGTSSSQFFKDI